MARSLYTLILAFVCLSLQAQTPIKDINSVKLNPDYIWAEATEETKEKAEEAAKFSLILIVKETNPSLDKAVIKASIAHCSQIYMTRGEMHRVFVYMEKKHLTEIVNSQPLDTLPPIPVSDSSLKPWQQNVIGKIMRCRKLEEVVNYLERMNAQNKITVMGTKSHPPRNPQKAFFVFFDNRLNTKAVLGKESDGKRMNYLTNKLETTKDYSQDVFIWFVLPI